MRTRLLVLIVRKDLESIFNYRGVPLKLVQAYVCAGKTRSSCFSCRGGAVKHVQLSLSARKSREISFHHCGSPVKLVYGICLRRPHHVQVGGLRNLYALRVLIRRVEGRRPQPIVQGLEIACVLYHVWYPSDILHRFKVAGNPVFSRSTNLESKLMEV